MRTNRFFSGRNVDWQMSGVAHTKGMKGRQLTLLERMGRRRGLKMKVQMPEDSENTESENEVTQGKEEVSSSSSVGGSSSEEEPQKKVSGSFGSSGSSSDSSEDSDDENPRTKNTDMVKVEIGSENGSSSSSSGDSSEAGASSSDDSESDEERPRKKKQTQKKKSNKSVTFKRLEKVDVSNSSSDDDSDLEETAKDSKEFVKEEADADDEESEDGLDDEQERGSETDSEDEWQARLQNDDDEEYSRGRERAKDEIVVESDKGSDLELNEDEWQDEDEPVGEKNDEEISGGDVLQAKHVMRNITARLSLIEGVAIRRGVKLSGPPIEFATTHLDEYARKFRWPQHIRNLRTTNFSQDPSEVLEDHDVLSELKKSDSNEQERPQESSFAQVPRPIVALAAEAFQRSSRKRKRAADRENQEDRNQDLPSASALLNIARIGGQFGDHFVESLLSANGKALQGIDSGFDYDKRCWSSLPTKKKPVANWRFVLEHVRRKMGRSESTGSALYPPMKQATLDRITSRLKTLYGHATQHEEYDVFQPATPTDAAGEEKSG